VALAEKLPESARVLRLVPAAEASPIEAAHPRAGDDLSGRDDAELVTLARAGQSSAFEALYRRHSPYALALAVRVQGNATDVEDIVHDTFLKVHDRLEDLRDGSSFRGWLSSVVVSLVRTRLRRRRFFGVFGLGGDDGLDLEVLVSPDASPEVRVQLAQIYTTLQSATVEQSICWTLRFIEGRKLEDVAEIAGCSLATAKRRIASVQELLLTSQAVLGTEAGAERVGSET
jgi:RNA polymerase sigma-70 factor (ECF subfamily)